jgi:aminopeptidase
MTTKFEKSLQKYAELAVHVGLNLRAGQRLLIRGPMGYGVPLNLRPLVYYLAEAAYKAGARLVDVMWGDDELELLRYKYAPRDSFDEFPLWKGSGPADYCRRGDAILTISASNPDLLAGQDPELVAAATKAAYKGIKELLDFTSRNDVNWCVIAGARADWASKIFPKLTPEKAEAKLWDAIFRMCRVDRDDPVAAWQEHIRDLTSRSTYLNSKQYTALKYAAPGTDLTIGLPKGHLWLAARAQAHNGVEFTANLPTEEVFTLPDLRRADGVVAATKPLNHGGVLIEDFSVTFKEGRAVEVKAKKGETALKKMIETDEGAARLGEVALVVNSSPISQSGLMFYNTLFDENASCHIALGKAYKFTLQGGTELSDEEFAARGGNGSLIHVDFMIGSGEMNIDGITEGGRAEPIMRKGEWAFKV